MGTFRSWVYCGQINKRPFVTVSRLTLNWKEQGKRANQQFKFFSLGPWKGVMPDGPLANMSGNLIVSM